MGEKYVLCNEENLTERINTPISNTKRIKYTCFDASEKYLVFGATSGSLYIFAREPTTTFIKLIPSKLQSISQIKISKQQRLIVFSNVKGQIGFIDIQTADNQVNVIQLEKSYVTCFCWENEERLYCGDQRGHVSVINLGYFMGRNILNITLKSVLLLDSPIVQIVGHHELLLVSTFAKCVLCNTDLDEYKQIGNRPRDGEYGACFHTTTDNFGSETKIYCARPGCRLWEVDMDGNVKHTHQFKSALSIPPAKPVQYYPEPVRKTTTKDNKKLQSSSTSSAQPSSDASPSNTFHFAKLLNFMNKFILTYSDSKFFIIDPTGRILLWTNNFSNIHSIVAIKSTIFIFTNTSVLCTVDCTALTEFALQLFQYGQYQLCGQTVKANLDYFISAVKHQRDLHQLYKLKLVLDDLNASQLADDLQKFFDEIFIRNNEIAQDSLKFGNGTVLIMDDQLITGRPAHNKVQVLERRASESNGIGIKEALVSAYDIYGKNLKYMIKGLKQLNLDVGNSSLTNGRPKVVNTKKIIIDDSDNNQAGGVSDATFTTTTTTDELDSPIAVPSSNNKAASKSVQATISEEEKLVRSLYLIYKSSKISALNFLDRYSMLFDRFDTRAIIELLKKLEQVIIENDELSDLDARRDCIKMYFDYLRPEIIYELDEECRTYIKESFMLINQQPSEQILRCETCTFPLKSPNCVCRYPKIGVELMKYYWSRKDKDTCFEIANAVPDTLETICKFYIQEKAMKSVVQLVISLANEELLLKAADLYDLSDWRYTFDIFCSLLLDQKINCLKCDHSNLVPKSYYDTDLFYTFNQIFATASNYLNGRLILDLLNSYSDRIPNGALSKDIYLNCLLNS